MTEESFPGEKTRLPFIPGHVLTDEEVIGINRRLDTRRPGPSPEGAAAAPRQFGYGDLLDDSLAPVAYRMPRNLMARAKARADVEGRTLSDVMREFLESYGGGRQGTEFVFVPTARATELRTEAATWFSEPVVDEPIVGLKPRGDINRRHA